MSFPQLKTGLIVDINNLYYAIQRKFGKGRKLMMLDYTKFLEELGMQLIHKVAYSRQPADSAVGFTTMLLNEGWEVHFGSTSFAIAMALRATEIAPSVGCFVLGTNFDEAGRILKWMKERGKITRCVACDIPEFFSKFSECTEITEALLSGAVKPT